VATINKKKDNEDEQDSNCKKYLISKIVEKYNPVENKWTFVSNLIINRYGHAACLL